LYICTYVHIGFIVYKGFGVNVGLFFDEYFIIIVLMVVTYLYVFIRRIISR